MQAVTPLSHPSQPRYRMPTGMDLPGRRLWLVNTCRLLLPTLCGHNLVPMRRLRQLSPNNKRSSIPHLLASMMQPRIAWWVVSLKFKMRLPFPHSTCPTRFWSAGLWESLDFSLRHLSHNPLSKSLNTIKSNKRLTRTTRQPPSFYLFDAPIELRVNFNESWRFRFMMIAILIIMVSQSRAFIRNTCLKCLTTVITISASQ